MENFGTIHKTSKIYNASDQILTVYLEWEVPIVYSIAPGQRFVVHAVTHDSTLLLSETTSLEIDFDSANSAIAVYMPGEISLGDDFYLVDSATSQRIKPDN